MIKSRKFRITICFGTLMYLGPIVYKFMGVGDSVALMALGSLSAIGSAYLGFNVLQKKIEGDVNG